jgi:hypothetical protein
LKIFKHSVLLFSSQLPKQNQRFIPGNFVSHTVSENIPPTSLNNTIINSITASSAIPALSHMRYNGSQKTYKGLHAFFIAGVNLYNTLRTQIRGILGHSPNEQLQNMKGKLR